MGCSIGKIAVEVDNVLDRDIVDKLHRISAMLIDAPKQVNTIKGSDASAGMVLKEKLEVPYNEAKGIERGYHNIMPHFSMIPVHTP